jgi:hypothetical protein
VKVFVLCVCGGEDGRMVPSTRWGGGYYGGGGPIVGGGREGRGESSEHNGIGNLRILGVFASRTPEGRG